MQCVQCIWISVLCLSSILDMRGTTSQTTCPRNCGNCKFDGTQLRDTTCANIPFSSIPWTLPTSLHHLTIKDVTNSFYLPLGELKESFLNKKADLETLSLVNCGIKALGVQCFQHNPKLTTLRLTNNHLRNMTEDNFHGLVKLEYLDLSQNKLTILSDFVFRQMTALKELKILLNELTIIGENSFKGLASIETIDVTSNQILSIHKDAFTGLTSLKQINLLSNRVSRLEAGTFSNLNNLVSVNLRNNHLIYIDSGSMTGTASMNHLVLAQNSLRTIPTLFLQRISSHQLETDLSRNNLTILSNGDLTKVYLKTLYIVGNQIKIVEPDAIKNSFIQKLDLQQNQLQHFPEAIQSHINQSMTLLLANNPWICDCDIYWMASILTNQTQAPVCAQPISFKGWTVSYFSKNVTMSCYFGSLPVPTKAIPVPPKQGIVTPALGTRSTSETSSTNQSNTTSTNQSNTSLTNQSNITMEPVTDKGENSMPIIAGSITGLLFLILITITVIYVYIKHVQAKVHCDNMGYSERGDFNSRTEFNKQGLQSLLKQE